MLYKASILKVVSGVILFVCCALPSYAQELENEQYQSMFLWGFNKNTSSAIIGGIVFKKMKRIKGKLFRTYGLEIMNVTHSQERRIIAPTGNAYIYGKSHYLYAIRLQYGYDWVLFGKSDRQGVEIKAVAAAGPSIGIVSPYYIERSNAATIFSTIHEPYDPLNPAHTYSRILGPGYLLEGLGQSKIHMGANVKVGLNFEMGTVKRQVIGFEIGFLLDAYFEKIVMLPTTDAVGIFPTFYFTLFYGVAK